jgi:hypothetical protein
VTFGAAHLRSDAGSCERDGQTRDCCATDCGTSLLCALIQNTAGLSRNKILLRQQAMSVRSTRTTRTCIAKNDVERQACTGTVRPTLKRLRPVEKSEPNPLLGGWGGFLHRALALGSGARFLRLLVRQSSPPPQLGWRSPRAEAAQVFNENAAASPPEPVRTLAAELKAESACVRALCDLARSPTARHLGSAGYPVPGPMSWGKPL